MLKRIQILPVEVASQIAAGEIVERPAAVVKELLENSLDAGAKMIEVEVRKGGKQLISVRDDGDGIDKDDLLLTITPHATSKITRLDDLNHINSLGFRGEALASISSVAQFSLVSKRRKNEMAWQLAVENQQSKLLPAAHPQGTTITVRDLFYNTPVRRKFLKAERTEFQHIEDVVKRVALSHFELSLLLRHNQRQIMQLRPANNPDAIKQRLSKVLGEKFTANALTIEVEHAAMYLQGWVLPATESRAHTDIQYFFVNGRMVKDRLLNHAVRSAFAETISAARYPGYVLYLRCDPAVVDVNVHPTKHEVRFQQTRLVHDFVKYSLQHLLIPTANTIVSATVPSAESPVQHVYEPVAAYKKVDLPKKTAFATACGWVAQRFIIAQTTTELFLLDSLKVQVWLQKKLIVNAKNNDGLRAQPLLIPQTIQLSVRQVNLLLSRNKLWQQFGIGLEQASPNTLLLRTLPACLRTADMLTLLKELPKLSTDDAIIDCLVQHSITDQELSLVEMNQLLLRLSAFPVKQLIQEKLIKCFAADELIKLFK